MSGRRRIALIVLGVAIFLGISGLLARFFSTENLERQEELALLHAQAAGDAPRMLAILHGCEAEQACVAAVTYDARALRHGGSIKLLSLSSSTAYSFSGATGKTRLAWERSGGLPVVQCVLVRRSGTFVSGMSVQLVSIGRPIPKEASC